MKDKEYFRANMYIIVGGYVLYLAFKLFNEMYTVKEESPVLPWLFIILFFVAGVGFLFIGGKIFIKKTKEFKEAAQNAEEISLDFLDESEDTTDNIDDTKSNS